jgi:nucleoside-diphosphate-sugar epimerase
MFQQVYGLPVVLVRPFMTYGPGQKRFKIVPYVITSLLKGEPPRISSGNRLVDWIYVDDVIDAFMMAGTAPSVEGLTFDIGTETLVSIRSVVERIHDFLGGPVPEFTTVASRTTEQIRPARTSLATQRLGWRSKTSLDVGLLKTIASYQETAPSLF